MRRGVLAKIALATVALLVPRLVLSQNLAPLSIAREGHVYAGALAVVNQSERGAESPPVIYIDRVVFGRLFDAIENHTTGCVLSHSGDTRIVGVQNRNSVSRQRLNQFVLGTRDSGNWAKS